MFLLIFEYFLVIQVYFNYDHLKGSPFTVKWTSTKSFEQKHSELRKALSKLKRAKGSCTLLVRRDQVLEDSFAVFQRMDSALLHYPTEVQFFNEQGVDAGGLTRLVVFNSRHCIIQLRITDMHLF